MGDRLVFAFRHFPLAEVHPFAIAAALAAEAAGCTGSSGRCTTACSPATSRTCARRTCAGTPRRSGYRRRRWCGRRRSSSRTGWRPTSTPGSAAGCAARPRCSSTACATAATHGAGPARRLAPGGPLTVADRHLQPAARPGRAQQPGRPRRDRRGHRRPGRRRRGGAGGRPRAATVRRAATRWPSSRPSSAERGCSPPRCSATRRCAGSAARAPTRTRGPGIRHRPDQQAAADGGRDLGVARRRPGPGPSAAARRPPAPIPYRDGEPRAALRVTVEAPWGPVAVTTAHLSFVPWRGRRQLATVGQFAHARAGRRRAPRCSSAISTCRRGWSSRVCGASAGGHCLPGRRSPRGARSRSSTTCSSGGLVMDDLEAGPAGPSDHLPLTATLRPAG